MVMMMMMMMMMMMNTNAMPALEGKVIFLGPFRPASWKFPLFLRHRWRPMMYRDLPDFVLSRPEVFLLE